MLGFEGIGTNVSLYVERGDPSGQRPLGDGLRGAGYHMFLKSAMSDEALLERCRHKRDLEAFDTLFRRHKDAFYRFLMTLAGESAVAEDVSQQCWLRLLEALTAVDDERQVAPRSFKTYLFTMGRNLYIDQYVRRHEHACRSDRDVYDLLGPESDTPEREAQRRERADDTLRALATLPEAQREVIALWAGGMDIDSIARITDAPRNTVLSRKRYAVAKLRDAMAPHAPPSKSVLTRMSPKDTGQRLAAPALTPHGLPTVESS